MSTVTKGMPAKVRADFLNEFANVTPHTYDPSADPEGFDAPAHADTPEPYTDVSRSFYHGFAQDYRNTRGEQLRSEGARYGFILYGGVISKAPHAFYQAGLESLGPESIAQIMYRSFDKAVLPVLSLPNDSAKQLEASLGIKSPTGETNGYEVARDEVESGSLVFRIRPSLILGLAKEVDEDELAESGKDYDTFLQERFKKHCGMPLAFHRTLWRKHVSLCVGTIVSDIERIRDQEARK